MVVFNSVRAFGIWLIYTLCFEAILAWIKIVEYKGTFLSISTWTPHVLPAILLRPPPLSASPLSFFAENSNFTSPLCSETYLVQKSPYWHPCRRTIVSHSILFIVAEYTKHKIHHFNHFKIYNSVSILWHSISVFHVW